VDPDAEVAIKSVTDTPVIGAAAQQSGWWSGMTGSLLDLVPKVPYAPFSSPSTYRIFRWFYQSETKSLSDLISLVRDVLLARDFDVTNESITNFNLQKELHQLDSTEEFSAEDGWTTASVEIPVPIKGVQIAEDATPHCFKVAGLYYCKIIGIIRNVFSQAPIGSMHLTPFKLFWEKSAGKFEQIFNKIYNSKAMYSEFVKI
jgi:hypothetical protein